MSDRFPIYIHRRDDAASGTTKFLATTALVKLADAPEQLQTQLEEWADAYARTLDEARAALADARRDVRERTRAYWRVGEAIRDFDASLDAAGFYLVGQTETFARDLGLHPGSLRKILAFHRRNADPNALDAQAAWTQYRERRENT
jgi:hypothetical protein